jgi:hypothetical protein
MGSLSLLDAVRDAGYRTTLDRYAMFLLSRIKEARDELVNTEPVAVGLERNRKNRDRGTASQRSSTRH